MQSKITLQSLKTKNRASPVDKEFAKLLKTKRIQLGITLTEVAQRLNVSQQQVQKYERGKNRVSVGHLTILMPLLQISIDDFVKQQINQSNLQYDNEYSKLKTKKLVKIMSICKNLTTSQQDQLIRFMDSFIKVAA